MMSCSQSSVSDDDEELGGWIYNSSLTVQRIRAAAAAETTRASCGVVSVQNPPPVSSLREEDPDLEVNTRSSILGQSGFQQ